MWEETYYVRDARLAELLREHLPNEFASSSSRTPKVKVVSVRPHSSGQGANLVVQSGGGTITKIRHFINGLNFGLEKSS